MYVVGMAPNGTTFMHFTKIDQLVRELKWGQTDIHTAAAALRKENKTKNWAKNKSWRVIRQFG
jgi:hypothetical protein